MTQSLVFCLFLTANCQIRFEYIIYYRNNVLLRNNPIMIRDRKINVYFIGTNNFYDSAYLFQRIIVEFQALSNFARFSFMSHHVNILLYNCYIELKRFVLFEIAKI